MNRKMKEYVKPELTLKYFLFDGDIATISDVNSSQAGGNDNVTIAPDESNDWWDAGGMDD